MTFAAVGSNTPINGTISSFSLTTHGVGNLVIVPIACTSTSTITALSSSHVTWSVLVSPVVLSVSGQNFTMFIGKVTSVTTATVTLTISSGTPGILATAQEFSTTAGYASVALDTSGTVNATTSALPSMTPSQSGDLYITFGVNGVGFSNGTTSGYVYNNNADGQGNELVYNVACSGSTQSPTMGSSTACSFLGALVKEVSAASGPTMINPGPTWFDTFKPGLRKPRPVLPQYTETEQGPLNIVLPVPLISLTGTDVNPADMPMIQPGPAWLDTFKPGMRKPRPQTPVLPYRTAGEQGPLNIVLPVPLISLTGTDVNPRDMPQIQPGPQWLDQFKPGMPRRNRPVTPPDPGTKLITAPLSVLLPPPVISLSGTRLRQPENLGAVLTLPSPNGATVEVVESATCTLLDIDATLVLPSPNATLVGWTMLTAPLTLSEFNDVTIDIAVTQNGSPYNLTGVTVNLLFKSAAGTPDGSALVFSSGGGSPAITITNAVGGLAVAVIPSSDLQSEVYFFYRVDVVNAGLTNTCLYGPITWISL